MTLPSEALIQAVEEIETELDSVDTEMESNEDDVLFVPPSDQREEAAIEGLYGDKFPLLVTDPSQEDWVTWVDGLWDQHGAGQELRLRLVERNRLMRRGTQWLSSIGGGPWREPPKPRDVARVVFNMIGPALDQRVQLVMENRPGFRATPASRDVEDVKRAEAAQAALEYQFDQQNMRHVMREATYWAGTDGVSFIHLYWDPDRGPWHEYYDGTNAPLGDIAPQVLRIEQVRVSAEASATQKPWYVIVRDLIPYAKAVKEYGAGITEEVSFESEGDTRYDNYGFTRLGQLYPDIEELHREQKMVRRSVVYCEPSEWLPQGLMVTVVGGNLVHAGPLPTGCVPIIRWTDGSADPSYFPTPIMDMWIDTQMRVNAILSRWVENIRINAGPRLIAKQHGIVGETLLGGVMSVIEVKGLGEINQIVRPVEGFSLAADAKELLDREIKNFENLSGWNEVSRGQFSSEQSGRAILAIREQLERIFAPTVNAASDAMSDWGEITLKWMKWGYDIPRSVSVMGRGRPDLAREFSSEDFDGVADIFVDPETMMPMPRSLRLFLLDDLYQKGLMPPHEYRRRLPFALTQNLGTPDEDQESRARRVCEMLRNGQNPPILWVDDEAIHQDVLQRELILPDDTDPMLRQMAMQRWAMLAQQASMKAGLMMGPMGAVPQGGASAPPQGGGQPSGTNPQTQPLQGTNPSVATPAQAGGLTDEERDVRLFENTQTQ